jgi:hypothetical protein
MEVVKGFSVYDKSGYVFRDGEINHNLKMENNLDIFGDGPEPTEIDTGSKQFTLGIQKLIKEAFYTSYLKSPVQGGMLSENIMTKNLEDILPTIKASKNCIFLDRYLPKNRKETLKEALAKEFPTVRERKFVCIAF